MNFLNIQISSMHYKTCLISNEIVYTYNGWTMETKNIERIIFLFSLLFSFYLSNQDERYSWQNSFSARRINLTVGKKKTTTSTWRPRGFVMILVDRSTSYLIKSVWSDEADFKSCERVIIDTTAQVHTADILWNQNITLEQQ